MGDTKHKATELAKKKAINELHESWCPSKQQRKPANVKGSK